MRSIPGTITEYKRHADQVELLDLSPAERHAKISANLLAEAQAKADEANAALVALQEGRA